MAEREIEEEAQRLEVRASDACVALVGDIWPVLVTKQADPDHFRRRARENLEQRAAEVARLSQLKANRPSFRESLAAVFRWLSPRQDQHETLRRARLDRKAEVERAARERL